MPPESYPVRQLHDFSASRAVSLPRIEMIKQGNFSGQSLAALRNFCSESVQAVAGNGKKP